MTGESAPGGGAAPGGYVSIPRESIGSTRWAGSDSADWWCRWMVDGVCCVCRLNEVSYLAKNRAVQLARLNPNGELER